MGGDKFGGTRDLILSRVFNTPPEIVWQAWTQPERLMRWFAPHPLMPSAAKVELKPGGHFLYGMRSPEGAEFWGKGAYREIVPPERLVYVDVFVDQEGNPVTPEQYGLGAGYPAETLVTVTFEDQGGKTLLTLRHAGFSDAAASETSKARWNSQLDRLSEALTDTAA